MTPAMGYAEMKDSGVHWIGQIPKEWKVQKLLRCFGLIGSGTTPKSQVEDYYNGNIPWLQSGDINGGIVESTAKSIKEIALTECSALRMYNAPFIAVAMYGASIANTSIVAIDACTNQACCVLSSPQNGIDYKFVFYAILSAKEELLLCARGGTQPNISQEILKQFRLPLPSLQEQTAISVYLDAQCAKIDEIIAEAKASIEDYKQWKASIIYEAVTKGLDPTAEMKDSGIEWIGEMPAHWTSIPLKAVTSKIGSGKTPAGGAETYQETGVLFLRSQNIYNTGLKLEGAFCISEDIDAEMANTRVRLNDVLLNITGGSIGRCCLFDLPDTAANVNQHVCIIRATDAVIPQFIRYFWNSAAGPMVIEQYQTGSNRQGLNFEQIGATRIPFCSKEEQHSIIRYLDHITNIIEDLISEKELLIADLETYKKSLIYEVVTGKRRVC